MLPACPQAGVMVRVAGKMSQWEHAQILAVQSWGAVRCELHLRHLKTKQFYSGTPSRHRNCLGMSAFEDRRMAWGVLPVFTALCWTPLWMHLSLSLLLMHSSPRNQHLLLACAHSRTQHTTAFASSVSQVCTNVGHRV